jgi:hypothetical protein
LSSLLAIAACAPAARYDYTHLPSGYQWRAVYNPATNAVVFYGQDPLTKDTVYVGPDSRFFIFHHPGKIEPKDLTLHWMPHDAR